MDDSIRVDAVEFGRHVKQGGWRLGLLVARNVEPGAGTGRPKTVTTVTVSAKVSAQAFGKQSGTSAPRVLRYLAAWEKSAADGHVPAAASLSPGQDIDLDADRLPPWGEFYTATDGNANMPSTSLIAKGLETATPAKLKTVVAALPVEAKAALVREALSDEAAANEAMADTGTRLHADAASSRVRDANRGQAQSERKARDHASPRSQEDIDNEGITKLFARSGTIIDAWKGFARLWADVIPTLSDDARADAVALVNRISVEAGEIEDALRGENVDTLIDTILGGQQ